MNLSLSRFSCHSIVFCLTGIGLVFFSVVMCAAEHPVNPSQPGISLQINNETGTALILEARQASLGAILKEIADKTGALIHYSVLPEAPVTATCAGVSVRQIMDCLVGTQLGLVASSPQPGKVAEFWLLGSSVGSCKAITIEPAIAKNHATYRQRFMTAQEQEALAEIARHEQSDQLLQQLNSAGSTEHRVEALANLASDGDIEDADVRKALDEAINDKNPSIRAQALATLANLDKQRSTAVLGRALQDKDVSVRMLAVDSAHDVGILQQALVDTDAGVRDYAAAKLAEIRRKEGS